MIKKATRHQKKLRMALIGSSGSGKTKTALELAMGLANGGKIGMIDTERGRGSLYANRYDYDVIELENFDPLNYIRAIDEFVAGEYAVLIVDSFSHAWMGIGGVLDKVNAAQGNSFTDGWGKIGTPLQNKLIEKLLSAPLHIIVSIRQKTEYVVEVNERGKSVPKKIGLAPVQRNDVEYEFDFVGLMDMTHTLTVEKSYDDNLPVGTTIPTPTRKVSERLLSWLQQGDAPAVTGTPPTTPTEPTNGTHAASDRAANLQQLRALRKQETELLTKRGVAQTLITKEEIDAMSDETIVDLVKRTESNVLDLRAALQPA